MNDQPCKKCGQVRCYEHCQEANDFKHIPDMRYGTVIADPGNENHCIVDFNCRLCGVSGSVGIDADDVIFE